MIQKHIIHLNILDSMILITAPSKTQTACERIFTYTEPELIAQAEYLNQLLKQFDHEELSRLMKTSEKLTKSTYHRIHSFAIPFTAENSRQAIFTFQGDAYDAIDSENYTAGELTHAQEHLRILSGLYGILKPLDLMQPYRLEMGTKLAAGELKNLYQYWKNDVTTALIRALEKHKDKSIINLASTEYSKVIDRKQLPKAITMVNVIFKQPHKNGYKTIPIHSKRARGLMIHFMIVNQLTAAEELKDFDLNGYSFVGEESNKTEYLFIQK